MAKTKKSTTGTRRPKGTKAAAAAPAMHVPAPGGAVPTLDTSPADGLTPKQRYFVLEYLVDMNATRAAIQAGYSPRTARQTGSENLSKPDIRALIDAVLAERTRKLEVRIDDVLRGLLCIAKADLARVVDENDRPRQIQDIPEDVRLAITGWEVKELFEGRGEDREHIGRLHTFKFGNKNEAWRDLGRYLKMFTDVTEDRGAGLTDEQRITRLAAIFDAARARKKGGGKGGAGGAPPA